MNTPVRLSRFARGDARRIGVSFEFFPPNSEDMEKILWESIERLAPMAKLFACKTYRDVTATAQQIFGGVGFTLEYDIQLYFRRAKQLQISWWDDRYLEELVAAATLDAP